MRKIYLFTTNFPYSTPESFLEEEIQYLSKRFEQVIILPFVNNTGKMRSVPANCEVIDIPLSKNRFRYTICGLFHYKTAGILCREFFRSKVFLSWRRLKAWIFAARCLNNCLYNKKLICVLRGMKRDDVAYFYWGTNHNLLSIILKGKVHLVSRFHGQWDLWEESYGGYHPLRTEVAHNLDKAVFIAKKGESYFKERYPYAQTAVFPLGTKDHGLQAEKPNDDVVRVISCSKVYPLKRVPLIFEALNSLSDFQIEWTHIGDGPNFEELKEKVSSERKSHLTVNLPGRISNASVLDFYTKHHFDMFMNLSTSEGVPVAIMEAMSFNIPIVATDVGSTSEEVPEQVGELLSPNPSIQEITNAIRKIVASSSSYTPRLFWQDHYSAAKNYEAFAEMLYNL